jgi:sugar lactone lactonase YvrE
MSTGQLWLIRSDGATFCLEKNMGTTNGIEVSPDGKHLFVNESVQRKIWKDKIIKRGSFLTKDCFMNFLILDWTVCDVM